MGQGRSSNNSGNSASHNSRPVVLILGGGYAGTTLAKELDATNDFFIVLVDSKDFFLHHIASMRACVEKNYAQQIMIPYDKLLTNGVVLHGVIERISPRTVHLYGRPTPITFDYLVIATGAKYGFPYGLVSREEWKEKKIPISGMPAIDPLKSFSSSSLFGSSPSSAATPASPPSNVEAVNAGNPSSLTISPPQPTPHYWLDTQSHFSSFYDKIKSAKRIIIIGGGCVGIQTAGELIEKYGAPIPIQSSAVASDPHLAAYDAAKMKSPTPASSSSSSSPTTKEIILIHSSAQLMNRQMGLRDKMREMALKRLQMLGVRVILNERVEKESILESSEIEIDCLKRLEVQGFLSPSSPESAFKLTTHHSQTKASTSYVCDFILSCTGPRYDSELFEQDPEIRTAVDPISGRLIVNEFFQLEGKVQPERRKASIRKAAGEQADAILHSSPASSSSSSASPSVNSTLHSSFSYHYPHIYALGDICLPAREIPLRISPQAYLAHKHALCVARNIRHMRMNTTLVPYEGSGPASVFLSIGSKYGVTQLPNRSQAIVGDAWSVQMKSKDLHVDANWKWLNQDRSHPSFHGTASERYRTKMTNVEKEKEKTDVATPTIATTQPENSERKLDEEEVIEPAAAAAATSSTASIDTTSSSSSSSSPPLPSSSPFAPSHRPLGTQGLTVNLQASASPPVVKSPGSVTLSSSVANSPIAPILDESQQREFEKAMECEHDEEDEEIVQQRHQLSAPVHHDRFGSTTDNV